VVGRARWRHLEIVSAKRTILCLHRGDGERSCAVTFLGTEIEVRRIGCPTVERVRDLVAAHDGRVDAVAFEGMPVMLELGRSRRRHRTALELAAVAAATPVVDGSGVRGALERWAVQAAARAEPGIFNGKRALMVPGLNHGGLAEALERFGAAVRYADPEIFFGLPELPGVGTRRSLAMAADPTLDRLRHAAFDRLAPVWRPGDSQPLPLLAKAFRRARVVAGDAGALLTWGARNLDGKTVVVEHAGEAEIEELRARGAAIAVILAPSPPEGDPEPWSAATLEAALLAVRPQARHGASEDAYLDLLGDLHWAPRVLYLQPQEAEVRRFAFVIHPLSISFIHRHPAFRWTRWLPDALVETASAHMPPMYISRIRGGVSPATGQRIEGHLISVGATPREMMRRPPRFTYDKLAQVARMAEGLGARILGLGAFTSVVGDAGLTVAHEAEIAVTSGNSLTVSATLEAAKQAVRWMGKEDLSQGRAMVVGATGSIGSVCARLLAQAVRDVVLVSIEPERLIELKRAILAETPGCRVVIATRTDELLPECDLVVTATSAFGQRILDISRCKPGAVICDVARPPDIGPEEAALRPDVLVIESGEVVIPGEVDYGYDIGLPAGTAYACLAETALLTMEGRFEDYTLGRRIEMERVKEIYRLFKKHGFRIAGLRSHGGLLSDEQMANKRALAEELRADPEKLRRLREEAAARLAHIEPAAKGVRTNGGAPAWLWGGLALAGAAVVAGRAVRRAAARQQ
jgi:predicted amino acid dehydrogenase